MHLQWIDCCQITCFHLLLHIGAASCHLVAFQSLHDDVAREVRQERTPRGGREEKGDASYLHFWVSNLCSVHSREERRRTITPDKMAMPIHNKPPHRIRRHGRAGLTQSHYYYRRSYGKGPCQLEAAKTHTTTDGRYDDVP